MANKNKGQIGVTTENIFPVIKQFLYSDHEIFLRELVANAVDATQKMKNVTGSVEAISADDLTTKKDEIATYPLARVSSKGLINLKKGVNPVWADQTLALAKLLTLDEMDEVMTGNKRLKHYREIVEIFSREGKRLERGEAMAADWLRDNMRPAQVGRVITAIKQAIAEGMRMETASKETVVIDPVLAELEKKEKKDA